MLEPAERRIGVDDVSVERERPGSDSSGGFFSTTYALGLLKRADGRGAVVFNASTAGIEGRVRGGRTIEHWLGTVTSPGLALSRAWPGSITRPLCLPGGTVALAAASGWDVAVLLVGQRAERWL